MAESDAASPKRRGRPPTRKNTAAERNNYINGNGSQSVVGYNNA